MFNNNPKKINLTSLQNGERDLSDERCSVLGVEFKTDLRTTLAVKDQVSIELRRVGFFPQAELRLGVFRSCSLPDFFDDIRNLLVFRASFFDDV